MTEALNLCCSSGNMLLAVIIYQNPICDTLYYFVTAKSNNNCNSTTFGTCYSNNIYDTATTKHFIPKCRARIVESDSYSNIIYKMSSVHSVTVSLLNK